MSEPRHLSLVYFSAKCYPEQYWNQYPELEEGKLYLYLGEIPNMPGHCVVVEPNTNKFHVGYHTVLFTEMKDD